MSLSIYKKKRSFGKTPEPRGKKLRTAGGLNFVVQKHDATQLHYDFRLEMEGVLKSWAVPKGPSMDPEVKRLAMMVEDHPFDYKDFEGIIPEGNYGAGTVMVWDEGKYEPAENGGADTKSQEKNLLHQWHAGKLKFILHGSKLKGEFALVKASGRGENAWLLMKLKDEYATGKDITSMDKSVKSKKTLKQIETTSHNYYQSNRPATESKKKRSSSELKKKSQNNPEELTQLISEAKKSPRPTDVKPMLATLVDSAFDDPEWVFEIKWDGYRAISYVNGDKVDIRSRNNLSFNAKFKVIVTALQSLNLNAVLDGEIIAMDEEGHADFQQLQGFAKNGGVVDLAYYVFDIIWHDGKILAKLPLITRKKILEMICPHDNPVIRYSDHISTEGKRFFKVALSNGLEGIMAKKMDSEYVTGFRTRNWLKIKNSQTLEAVICGFTEPRNSRKFFGAVILGKYFGKKLKYIGHSGSGFDEKGLKDLHKKFQSLITNKSPFSQVPKTNAPVTWLTPKLICEVKFSEWTGDKILRHPIFMGLREDKTPDTEKNEIIVRPPLKQTKKKKL